LKGVFSLEVEQLHTGIHIEEPEAVDVIYDQSIGDNRVARALYDTADVSYDIR